MVLVHTESGVNDGGGAVVLNKRNFEWVVTASFEGHDDALHCVSPLDSILKQTYRAFCVSHHEKTEKIGVLDEPLMNNEAQA